MSNCPIPPAQAGPQAGRIATDTHGLAAALENRTRSALACGALHPILTEQVEIDDGGVRFLVRVVSSLAKKPRHGSAEGTPTDPFLPPEPELTVAQVSDTHVAVLNKFNVLERHLLVVTRAFEHQETLLRPPDLAALFACMAQIPALGFYNGGTLAGASQPHKHLQLVPLPLTADGPDPPMAPLLAGSAAAGIGTCPGLPFRHAFAGLSGPMGTAAALEAQETYLGLLAALGIGAVRARGELRQSAPYNLLITDNWMLAVPRVAECFGSVSVNALGFAGSLFVKDREGLEAVRAAGPMTVLRRVAGD